MSCIRLETQRAAKRHPAGYGVSYVLLLCGGLAGVALVGLGSPSRPDQVQPLGNPGPYSSEPGVALKAVMSPQPDTSEPDVRGVLNQYCVACHNQTLLTAGLALDVVDASNPSADPETWEKVITKLRTGAMPPRGIPRPDPETYDAVAGWLEAELDQAWATNPNPGTVNAVHRLNRTEYNNAINDLLGLDFDVRDQLPGDETSAGGFDNVASNLTLSPLHIERYLSVAQSVTRLATGLPPLVPGSKRYLADDVKSQDVRMSEDLPLGSRGGMAIHHYFPVDGEYTIKIRLQKNYAGYVRGMGWPQELDVRIDGKLVKRFTLGGEARKYRPAADSYGGAGGGSGWMGSPEWEEYLQVGAEQGLEVRVPVTAGRRVVGISFTRDVWMKEQLLPQPPVQVRSQVDAFNQDYLGYAGVREVEINGPYQVGGIAKDTRSRREIFTCYPEAEAEEDACATEILSRMARRAYRRPVTDEDMQVLLEFFELGREDGGTFDHGIQFALERMLVDPDFLLRIYREPPSERPAREGTGSDIVLAAQEAENSGEGAEVYALSDLEVASRLSFFLWSSIPDETLLALAEEGRLTDPPVLRQQVRRMLADPRAHEALVEGFASQWLNLRLLDDHVLQDDIYHEYDHNLQDAMERETRLFIESTLREDRSILALLSADYTYVNERLADHYNIPDVAGSHFRRITLPDLDKRGGLLGNASLLAVTSYPDRTTPVLRGKWLLENILGLEVPPPPPNLDTSLDEPEDDELIRKPSIRERLARHRKDPVCASCHSVIDPLGYALEAYDAAGGRRTIDELGNPVDNTGTWPTGEKVKGLAGLREMLLDQKEQFVRTVTRKLMQYALGRELEYYDQPTVRRIVRDAEVDDYSWSSIILGIVESQQFLFSKRMGTVASVRSSQSK